MLTNQQRAQIQIEQAHSGHSLPNEIVSPHEEDATPIEELAAALQINEAPSKITFVEDAGDKIRQAREKSNRSIYSIAEQTGNTPETIKAAEESGDMTLKLAKTLERLFKKFDLTLISDNKPEQTELEEDDAEPKPTAYDLNENLIEKYDQLILELRPKVCRVLEAAYEDNFYKHAISGWKELRYWSATVVCPCGRHISVNEYSNHKQHYQSMSKKQIPNVAAMLDNRAKSFGHKKSAVSEEKLRKIYKLRDEVKKAKDEQKDPPLHRYEVKWKDFRQLVNDAYEEDPSVSSLGTKFLDPKMDILETHEILKLNSFDPNLAKLGLQLKTLNRKVLHCSGKEGCGKSFWDTTKWGKRSHFLSLSDKIVRSVIEACVTSTVIRPPKHVVFTTQTGEKVEVKIGISTTGAFERELLGEAVLSAFRLSDTLEVSLGNGGETWTAYKEDQPSEKAYVALATEVVQRLSSSIRHMKPMAAFSNEGKLNLQAREEWSTQAAINCLLALNVADVLVSIEKVRPNEFRYSDGTKANAVKSPNMVRLSDSLQDRIQREFQHNGKNLLEARYHRERLEPLLCHPEPRSHLNPDAGGYLTEGMQRRKPMVSDKMGKRHLAKARFNPSEEAVDILNTLQETVWTVDTFVLTTVREVLSHELREHLFDRLTIKGRSGHRALRFEKFDKTVSRIRHGQVREWLATFDFADQLQRDFPGKPHFWHAWQYDWRGRMIPTTNILSPQNDDVSRGLLRFAKPMKIDETGLKWLRRYTAGLCRDLTHLETLSKPEEYTALVKRLQDKRWESYDAVSNDPLFLQMLTEILGLEPLEGFKVWGKGSVFRSKGEGFQRLAAIKEFVNVIPQGTGALTSLPINLDASSSIYQHASALLKDKDMAREVNIVAQEDGGRADVYEQIYRTLDQLWKDVDPFENLPLSDDEKKLIRDKVLTRSFAKVPTMTRGYGQGADSITSTFLTHNGQPNGTKGKKIRIEPRDFSIITDELSSDGVEVPTAHPDSHLQFLVHENVSGALHIVIAKIVAGGYLAAIEHVLPSFDIVRQTLVDVTAYGHDKEGYSFLTHDKTRSGELGEYVCSKKTQDLERVQERVKFGRKGNPVYAAHPQSHLGFLYELNVDEKYHHEIAVSVAKGKTSLAALTKRYPAVTSAKDDLYALVDAQKGLNALQYLENRKEKGKYGNSLFVRPVYFFEKVEDGQENGKTYITPSAHENSLLAFLLQTNVGAQYHKVIAVALASGEYWQKKLHPYPVLRDHLPQIEKLLASAVRRHGRSLEWSLPDGSKVLNAYWMDDEEDTKSANKPWVGPKSKRQLVAQTLKLTKEQLPLNLCMMIDDSSIDADAMEPEQVELLQELINSERQRLKRLTANIEDEDLKNLLENAEGQLPWKEINQIMNINSNKHPSPTQLNKSKHLDSDRLRTHFYPERTRVTMHKTSDWRNHSSELTSIAPNFVHSIDGLHMRRFIRQMKRMTNQSELSLWSVHDSFGCHANLIDMMRTQLQEQFAIIHGLGDQTEGILLNLVKNTMPEQDYEAFSAEIGTLTYADFDSQYFVN